MKDIFKNYVEYSSEILKEVKLSFFLKTGTYKHCQLQWLQTRKGNLFAPDLGFFKPTQNGLPSCVESRGCLHDIN